MRYPWAFGLSVLLSLPVGIGGCTVRSPEPNLAGQDVALTVMHTSDLHSRFFPYFFAPGQIDRGLGLVPKPGQTTAVVGGIARVSTIVQCARGRVFGPACDAVRPIVGAPATRSLHLDSGDIFQGAPVFNLFNGEVEVRAMTQLGLTAMALGNHEFDKGSPNLVAQLQRFGGFQMLAANYQFGDPLDYTQPKLARVIPPWMVVNANGIRIGIIGMANLTSIQSIIEGGNSTGVRPIEPTQAMAQAVQILRPMVDLLFVTSHLGLDEDEDVATGEAAERDENGKIALEGVDVIFGGHLHIVLNPPKDLPQHDADGNVTGHTLLVHSGAFAKYVGRLDLVVHMPTDEERAAGQRAFVKAHTYRVIPVNDQIPDDPRMLNMLERYQLQMNQFLNLTQVYALVPCPSEAGVCPKTPRNDPEGGDSQLGNLVATSMRLRRRVEADFALTNSLGIRSDFESGPLNLEQMYNVFPFENTIATMFLSGVEVQQMLDFVAARSAERGCRTQAQVSGIYFDMVCHTSDAECNDRLGAPSACAKNIFIGERCRMPDGTFEGTPCKPLDEFGLYRVAVNDYIANGGSGFAVLKRNTTKFNTGISLRDALIEFIRTLPGRCDPALYGNVYGVSCRTTGGEVFDCTEDCCCHDESSGPLACSNSCAGYQACKDQLLNPEINDYSDVSCLDQQVEAHDGRIQPITAGSGT